MCLSEDSDVIPPRTGWRELSFLIKMRTDTGKGARVPSFFRVPPFIFTNFQLVNRKTKRGYPPLPKIAKNK
jgi:hypothetical protein